MPGTLYEEIVARGEARGELKRLRITIADLCEALDIALTPERNAWVQAAELGQLDELRLHLKRERAWPETLPG